MDRSSFIPSQGGGDHENKIRGIDCCFVFAPGVYADAPSSAGDEGGLAEVVVTAEKFKSTIQETPISISAISASQLEAQGITNVEDIARDVPGLSMRSAGPGLTEYDARGLASNGGAAPTVGFYLDEIPLSRPPCRSPARSSSTRTCTTSIASRCCAVHRGHCTAQARWAALSR